MMVTSEMYPLRTRRGRLVAGLNSVRVMPIVMTMVTVSKSVLKARMLEFFRQVEQTGEALVVTSDGVPVLKIVPFSEQRSVEAVFGDVRGTLAWKGKLDAPTSSEWSNT